MIQICFRKNVYTFTQNLFLKKLVVLILSLIYLTSSVGATVHLHYCMDKLIGWSLSGTSEKKCDKCGMEKKDSKGCCKDENKQVKLQNDQKLATFYVANLTSPAVIPEHNINEYQFWQLSFVAASFPLSHSPPAQSLVSAYLRNCVFRI